MDDHSPVRRGDAGRRRRSDAERSIAAILDAALNCVPSEGDFNMSAIARTAGVSRVTLYSHFPTREALIDAALQRAFAQTHQALTELPLDQGPPQEVLAQLLSSSWQVLEQHRNLYLVASANLPPDRLRAYAELVLDRIERLLARGRADGVFRDDLPLDWLVATVYTLMHLGAEQVGSGRTKADVAGELVSTTILSLLTATASGVPGGANGAGGQGG
ncbi:TetR/AcrR family transcriptional regulator [Streptomyces sp. NBC_01198]|uniref:TetR/AcrR family transcriptional regulator n=1 Tax=Streptomyces sp. NBC_01198 TaxID=2903769 RepID=UPI002E14F8BE|nr:TetR/AcrR family transcriptional regulator [Streptomyces sp. NBC_01198]